MNTITIHGRLARDPEIKFFNDDKAVCNISVAVNRAYKDKDGNIVADFFNCVSYNKQAEILDKYFKKGDGISIQGEMQNNKYTDKEGNKKDKWQIRIDKFDFELLRKGDGEPVSKPLDTEPGFVPVDESTDDEELPF
jgi:single-strand DNA-binding protein